MAYDAPVPNLAKQINAEIPAQQFRSFYCSKAARLQYAAPTTGRQHSANWQPRNAFGTGNPCTESRTAKT